MGYKSPPPGELALASAIRPPAGPPSLLVERFRHKQRRASHAARTPAGINRSLSMRCHDPPGRNAGTFPVKPNQSSNSPTRMEARAGTHMMRTVAHLVPFAALAGGILILLKPPLLNYVVGINHMYHFIR
jgi:Protein of unknown function (DUF3096)